MSSPVISLNFDTSFLNVWQLFKQKGFHHFPVTDDKGGLIGMISERNMLIETAKMKISANTLPEYRNVSHFMDKKVVTASPDTPVKEICRIMFEQRVGALPVADFNGELLGIITRTDILKAMIKTRPIELWV